MNNCREIKAEELDHIIIEGILEKKGKDIISIDLTGLDNSVCDSFIISHGDSGTQARAIADHIEEKVKKQLNFNVSHKEGYENLQWILLDYSSVVVHIFDQETRKYYQLEELWADGKIVRITEAEFPEIKNERND